MRNFLRIKNYRGDTIIEVILSIAVLGTAMSVAYVSTTHSLQVGTDAGNRNRSVGYMQQQIEMIKAAEQSDPAELSDYIANPGQPFCIDPASGGKIPAPSSGACQICVNSNQTVAGFADTHGNCAAGSSPGASLSIMFGDHTRVFTSSISWDAPNGLGEGKSVAYYKLADSSAAGLPSNTLSGDIEVMSNPGLPIQPRLIVYANGVSTPANILYDVTYPVGPTKCNNPGPGEYTTPAPSQFTSSEDTIDERCGSYPLNIDLSAFGAPVTSIKFDFLNDGYQFRSGHFGDDQYLMDNNVILRNVRIPGKTVTLASYCSFSSPSVAPNVPLGSQIPPYSLWMLWNHCPATFSVN